jgi:hypothetical protein
MFNLDQEITDWRRQMAAAGIKPSKVVDELENHLREDIRILVSAGTPEGAAFQIAAGRLGGIETMSSEFKKINRTSSMSVGVGGLRWAGISIALAIGLLTGLSGLLHGKPSLLLMSHIITLTAGYGLAFLTGGFGIYYVSCRWFLASSPTHQQALIPGASLFTQLSVTLVGAGLMLGMFWSVQNRGHYFTGDAREIGTLGAFVWLAALWLIQRFGQMGTHATMLLYVVGNVIISLAWFGAGTIAHGVGIRGYWPLDVLLGVHLTFLAMGVVPRTETAQA